MIFKELKPKQVRWKEKDRGRDMRRERERERVENQEGQRGTGR